MMLASDMERAIVRTIARDALARGYTVSVSGERGYDTDDMLVASTDVRAILAEATSYDECHLFAHEAGVAPFDDDGTIDCLGWVFLVFGNDGYDVISDYTTNLETLLTGANALADRYADNAD